MAVGNADLIKALFLVKSNLDSGVSQAVQQMGIRAMETPQSYLDERNAHYQIRRDKVISALKNLGLNVEPPKASLYVWAPVPTGFTAASFATAILDGLDMVVTPGTGYGKFGEGYIRLSLTLSDDDLEEGVRRLEAWKIPTAG
jgi:LL-diaminopimelate aminotransferase